MRPISIVNFERIVLLSIGLGVINTFMVWDRVSALLAANHLNPNVGIIALAIVLALYGLLIWFISRRGSVVAKWIYVVFTAIGLVYGLTGIGRVAAQDGTFALIFTIVQDVLAAVSVWLLFRPDASAWFRGERAADPDVSG